MRRLLVLLLPAALLIAAAVPATSAATAVPKNVAGNFVIQGGDEINGDVAMILLEARTNNFGQLVFGYYKFENIKAWGADTTFLAARTQGTVDSVRFFTAPSGAPAAEIIGHECILMPMAAAQPTVPCGPGHYRIIVTDGGANDTFCGGNGDANPGDWDYCPYVSTVIQGNIKIYSSSNQQQ